MMVPDLDHIGEKLFFVVILGGLEGFENTTEIMEGDAIPEGYITNFHSLEVDINDGVMDISGF